MLKIIQECMEKLRDKAFYKFVLSKIAFKNSHFYPFDEDFIPLLCLKPNATCDSTNLENNEKKRMELNYLIESLNPLNPFSYLNKKHIQYNQNNNYYSVLNKAIKLRMGFLINYNLIAFSIIITKMMQEYFKKTSQPGT